MNPSTPGAAVADAPPRIRLAEALALAAALTAASHALPRVLAQPLYEAFPAAVMSIGYPNVVDLLSLAFGLLLVLPTARDSGVVRGRRPGLRVALVTLAPVVATAAVYPFLPVRPFAHERIGLWLISPLAQDCLFNGYLNGLFARTLPADARDASMGWRPGRQVLLASAFFAAWHLPNLATIPVGYVLFQLAYTFAGAVLIGLTRQWTGAMWYATLTHMAANAIVWAS